MNLSAEHLITIAVTVGAIAGLVFGARLRPGPWTVVAARALGIVIVGNEIGWWIWQSQHGGLSIANDLPLHLCDVAGFVSASALWTRRQLLVELAYFWGIAGSANGVFTPDISSHFPTYPFIQYFLQHGAIPGASLFLVFGLRLYPRPWATVRVYVITAGLLVVDAFANLLTNGNYLFLRQPPPGNNLLDLMGPWPWYIAVGAVVAAVIFTILDLPFRISSIRSALRSQDRSLPA